MAKQAKVELSVGAANALFKQGERKRQRTLLCQELLSTWLRRMSSESEADIEQSLRDILPLVQEVIENEAPRNSRFELCNFGSYHPQWPSRTRPPAPDGTLVARRLVEILEAAKFKPEVKWKWTSELPGGGGCHYLSIAVGKEP